MSGELALSEITEESSRRLASSEIWKLLIRPKAVNARTPPLRLFPFHRNYARNAVNRKMHETLLATLSPFGAFAPGSSQREMRLAMVSFVNKLNDYEPDVWWKLSRARTPSLQALCRRSARSG